MIVKAENIYKGLFFKSLLRSINVGFIFFLLISIIAACSDTDSVNSDKLIVEEAAFFVADKNASGPLTLAELKINIPKKIDKGLSDSKRSCFFNAVERRAHEAGDPSLLNPNAFPYWGGSLDRVDWSQNSKHMQRIFLAQAIVSWSMSEC